MLFCIGIIHFLATAHLLNGFFEFGFIDAEFFQHFAQFIFIFGARQHEQLAGDVLIFALLRQLVGNIKQACQIG